MLHSLPDMQVKTTDVLEILAAQHTEMDELIEQIKTGNGTRRAAFNRLADLLAAHSTVEEKVFYPAIMAKQTNEMLHEAVEEHLQIKRLLADLLMLDLDRDEETFSAKLQVLAEELQHHAHKEEEGKMFPLVRELLDEEELAGIGNEVIAMFEELLEDAPSQSVPSETAEAAPLPQV